MSERKFSKRRKGGMRFRPKGGLSSKAAAEARAAVKGEKPADDPIFASDRHETEIALYDNPPPLRGPGSAGLGDLAPSATSPTGGRSS